MNEGYQLPPLKPTNDYILELTKAILDCLPQERRHFQEVIEAVLLPRLAEQQWMSSINLLALLVLGEESPSPFLREEKKEAPEPDTTNRGKPRKGRQIQAANIIPFRPRQSA